MKKLLIYAISLFTALILTAPAMMANPGHIARTFNIHDGLPSGDIATVAQDDRGLIWLGTWSGLSFYDGYRIYTFRSGNTTGRLTTNRIMELQPDSLDNVWFLTYGNRLNLFDKASGRFVNLAEMLPKDAKIPNMRRLHRGEKAIWASNLNKSEIIRINYNPKSKSGYDIDWGNVGKFIPGARSFEGVVSAGGHTWILTDNAATLEGTKTSIKGHPAGIADADGTPYIITVDGHLFAYADGKAQALPTLSDFGKVAGIAADSAGHLAAATSAGYALYNIKTRKWDKYPIEAGISMIVADSNNRVWMFSPPEEPTWPDATPPLRPWRWPPTPANSPISSPHSSSKTDSAPPGSPRKTATSPTMTKLPDASSPSPFSCRASATRPCRSWSVSSPTATRIYGSTATTA